MEWSVDPVPLPSRNVTRRITAFGQYLCISSSGKGRLVLCDAACLHKIHQFGPEEYISTLACSKDERTLIAFTRDTAKVLEIPSCQLQSRALSFG